MKDGVPHAGDKSSIQTKLNTLPNVDDWDVIENHCRDFDERMIKKLDDDVNTLLVFAGLFSAVVTAFIIDSYKWLSVDDGDTNTQILTQISMQLASFTVAPPYVNSTHPTLQTPSQSNPTKAVVIINIFWFLSLVLGLVAALYGMIVKQWMREYLQWTTHSSPSYDVVYLRQIRFEAWEKWKVSWIIGTIPGLLEAALILFLCGMVYLLWTLNTAVAIVLTVAVTSAILLAFTAIVLPAFLRQCPYKSPVGWTCALLWEKASHMIKGGPGERYQFFPDWRRRDMYEVAYASKDTQGEAKRPTLSRALQWVKGDSQNPLLLNHANHCLDSLHWQRTATLLDDKLKRSLFVLRDRVPEMSSDIISIHLHEDYDLYRKFGPMEESVQPESMPQSTRQATFWLDTYDTASDPKELSSVAYHDVVDPLLEDLRSYLSFLAEHSTLVRAPIQHAIEIICLLYCSDLGRSSKLEQQSAFWNILVDFYNENHDNEGIDTSYPGLRNFIFQLLCRVPRSKDPNMEAVAINLREWFVQLDQHPAHIASEIFKSGLRNAEDCHIFVTTANMAIEYVTQDDISEHPDMLTRLFSNMSEALKVAIDNNWANWDSYTELPWVKPLLSKVEIDDQVTDLIYLLPLSLLERLKETLSKGLVRGDQSRAKLEHLESLWERNAIGISQKSITAALDAYPGETELPSTKNFIKFAELANHAISNVLPGSLTDDSVKRNLRKLFLNMSNALQIPLRQGFAPTPQSMILSEKGLTWINTLYMKVKFAKYAPLILLMSSALLQDLKQLWEATGKSHPQWHLPQLRRICARMWRKDSGATDVETLVSPYPSTITSSTATTGMVVPSPLHPVSPRTPAPPTPILIHPPPPRRGSSSIQPGSPSVGPWGNRTTRSNTRPVLTPIITMSTILERTDSQGDSSQRDSPESIEMPFFTPQTGPGRRGTFTGLTDHQIADFRDFYNHPAQQTT